MQETDRICPIDGRKLFASSGLYQDTWYDCLACGATYDTHERLDVQALVYICMLERDVGTKRSELERSASNLERITLLAKERGLLE